MVLNAQMAKAGPPMDGGICTSATGSGASCRPTAPLSISTLSIAGIAMAFSREGTRRVAVSFIGEGGSSLGEWHEAINLCAARRLPAVFCIENNQTALSTSVSEQSAARVFADKAAGYGIPGITIDGTDPDAGGCGVCVGGRPCASGLGPALIELVSMRMCGHAHHDDMLYLGKEPPSSWDYPTLSRRRVRGSPMLYAFWASKRSDRVIRTRLEAQQNHHARPSSKASERKRSNSSRPKRGRVIDAPWPERADAGARVFAGDSRGCASSRSNRQSRLAVDLNPPLPPEDPGLPFDARGTHSSRPSPLGVADALRADPRVFVYGEDVGGRYGNSFLLLRPLLDGVRRSHHQFANC